MIFRFSKFLNLEEKLKKTKDAKKMIMKKIQIVVKKNKEEGKKKNNEEMNKRKEKNWRINSGILTNF